MSQVIADCPLEQVHVDPTLTLASATGAISAYADFEEKPIDIPSGYQYVDRFTGCAKILLEAGQEEPSGLYKYPEERFGLIFRSTVETGTYLVAFRGTDSIWDIIKDLYFKTVPFKPYNAPKFPKNVMVATGFNGIYADKCGSMAASMRAQLFTKLEKLDPAPKKVFVTGHSLGGALASLFTLDVAASRRDLQVFSTTFASPRVGTKKWQSTYNKKFDLETVTFRIANHWDYVPSLPPELYLGYEHIGQQFLAAFYVENAWWRYLTSRHSMLNHQTVLSHAVYLPDPQVWEGKFKDAVTGFPMISECPPSTVVPPWADIVRQEEESATVAAE